MSTWNDLKKCLSCWNFLKSLKWTEKENICNSDKTQNGQKQKKCYMLYRRYTKPVSFWPTTSDSHICCNWFNIIWPSPFLFDLGSQYTANHFLAGFFPCRRFSLQNFYYLSKFKFIISLKKFPTFRSIQTNRINHQISFEKIFGC